jgi:hypothetical protein
MRPNGAEFFHGDGQTDKHMTKQTFIFQHFSNKPKNDFVSFNSGILFWIKIKIKSIFRESELYNIHYFTISKGAGSPHRCVEALQTHTYV